MRSHPLAALLGIAALLLFMASGATLYGYLTLSGWTVNDFAVLGAFAVVAGIAAYWWEEEHPRYS